MTSFPIHPTGSSMQPADARMADNATPDRATPTTGRKLGILLACFGNDKAAAKARGPIEANVTSGGGHVLDSVVLKLDAKHKVSVYDPRRVAAGILIPAVTWGVFGWLASGGVRGALIWGVIGAICGGLFAYFTEHLLTRQELAHLGTQLTAPSSALIVFAETADPAAILAVAGAQHAPVASIATIDDDLSARVLTSAPNEDEGSPATAGSLLRMILVRYGDPATARQVVSRLPAATAKAGLQVELIVRADRDGKRQVEDPTHGEKAMARSDVMSWGGFGLVWGAIVGFAGNGGILSSIDSALVTGVLWAIFGLVAGALYGAWAGRATSARGLAAVGSLLAPGTSMVLAWADGPTSADVIETLSTPDSRRLILSFRPVDGGAMIAHSTAMVSNTTLEG
jgi:hypothetical protein